MSSESKYHNNPIIIIDDDQEDLDMIKEAFKVLNVENEIIAFENGLAFLDFMRGTSKKAFFILCDINMNKVSGLELKKRIFEDDRLRQKCIPFLFFSSSKASPSIALAYSYNVQGYFIKPNSINEIKDILESMIIYWGYSQHPNS